MKIAVIINYPLKEQIEIGHFDILDTMFKNFLKIFDEVHVISLGDDGTYNLGKNIISHPLNGKNSIRSTRYYIKETRRIIKENNIDVVRALATIKSGYVAADAIKNTNLPLILSVHVHRTLYHKQNKRRYNPIMAWILNRCEKKAIQRANIIGVISYFIRDYVTGLGADKNKIVLHRNFVNTKLFRPNPIKHKNKRFVFVSRLEKPKGTHILLDAFAEIQKKRKDVELWICGDGVERKSLEKQTKDLKLKNVKFLGYVKHEKLPDVLNRCDLFVAPCQAGFVLNEAFACGLPAVAADIEWSKEIISDKTGKLVPFGSIKALSNAVLELIADEKKLKEKGKNARIRISKEFSFDGWKKRELDFVKQVMRQ